MDKDQNQLLFVESPIGYTLFYVTQIPNIANKDYIKSFSSFNSFSKICSLETFYPLEKSIKELSIDEKINSLSNVDEISNNFYEDLYKLLKNEIPLSLKNFLESKFSNTQQIFFDSRQKALSAKLSTNLKCSYNENLTEHFRYIKIHYKSFIPKEYKELLSINRISLANFVFRKRIKFDAQKSDESLVQCYGAFKETEKVFDGLYEALIKCVGNWIKGGLRRFSYLGKSRVCKLIKMIVKIEERKGKNLEYNFEKINEFLRKNDKNKILLSSNDINYDLDKANKSILKSILKKLISLSKDLKLLDKTLKNKVKLVAPNLYYLVGANMSAELIMRSGSLIKMSMLHSNFIQLLGAEKQLFSALKKKKNTPKYGIIKGLIDKNKIKGNKGMLCKIYSNKCALASRIDAYSEDRSGDYGKKLKKELNNFICSK